MERNNSWQKTGIRVSFCFYEREEWFLRTGSSMNPLTSPPIEMTIMVALPYNAYPAATISRPVTNPSPTAFASFCRVEIGKVKQWEIVWSWMRITEQMRENCYILVRRKGNNGGNSGERNWETGSRFDHQIHWKAVVRPILLPPVRSRNR